MPAHVAVPVRIRTDTEVLESSSAELDDALERALGRALVRAANTVLPRHRGPIQVDAPSFTWSGKSVSPEQRAELERRIADLLGALTSTLTQSAEPAPDSSEKRRPQEPFDPSRATADSYAIPSYDSAGAPQEVSLTVKGLDLSVDQVPVFRGLDVAPVDITPEFIRKNIAESVDDGFEAPEAGAHPGILWMKGGVLYAAFIVGNGAMWVQLQPPSEYVWTVDRFVLRPQPRPSPALASLKVYGKFEPGNRDAYRAFVREVHENEIRANIPSDEGVNAEVDRRADALAQASCVMIMELRVGSWHAFYYFNALDVAFDGVASLSPVIDYVPVTEAKPAEGGGEAGETREAKFPSPLFGEQKALVCEPFEGEPKLDDLGAAADRVRAAIDDVAQRLQIEPCNYAGKFCLNAVEVIRSHAVALGDAAAIAETGAQFEIARGQTGNLGDVQVTLKTDIAGLFARIAATVPVLEELIRSIQDLYRSSAAQFSDRYHNNWAGWVISFVYEFDDQMNDAVGRMFAEACRWVMIQVLSTSRTQIEWRLNNIEQVADTFYQYALPDLIDVVELRDLLDKLESALEPPVADPETGWTPTPERDPAINYENDTPVSIRDSSGATWTVEELHVIVPLRTGLAEEVEPLVKHLEDLPAFVAAVRGGKEATRTELKRILDEMHGDNKDVFDSVKLSWETAFKYGPIDVDLPATGGDIGRPLRGIHLLVHQQLSPSFGGSSYYASGVRRLFTGEHAIEVLESLAVLGVLVVVSVVCPPFGLGLLAAAANIGVAAYGVYEAREKAKIKGAVMDPEQIADVAELDADEFAQMLGLALALIPEGAAAIKTASKLGAVVAEEGVEAAARVASAIARSAAEAAMERALTEGFGKLVAVEFVKVSVMNEVMQAVLAPVLQVYTDETRQDEPVGGVEGALALIAWYQQHGGGK